MGSNVVLVPVAAQEDLEIVQDLVTESGTEAGVDSFANPTANAVYWLLFAPKPPAVEGGGDEMLECVGYTSAHSFDYVARRCRGSIWIKSEHRGKGIASDALAQRNDLLFDAYNMNRIEWVIPADNAARLALAEKLGQTREGIHREAAFYDGKYHDLISFAMLRSDRPEVKE